MIGRALRQFDEAEWFILIACTIAGPIWAYGGAAFYDLWTINPGDSIVERLLHVICFWPIVAGLWLQQEFAVSGAAVFPLIILCGLLTSLAVGGGAILHLRRVA